MKYYLYRLFDIVDKKPCKLYNVSEMQTLFTTPSNIHLILRGFVRHYKQASRSWEDIKQFVDEASVYLCVQQLIFNFPPPSRDEKFILDNCVYRIRKFPLDIKHILYYSLRKFIAESIHSESEAYLRIHPNLFDHGAFVDQLRHIVLFNYITLENIHIINNTLNRSGIIHKKFTLTHENSYCCGFNNFTDLNYFLLLADIKHQTKKVFDIESIEKIYEQLNLKEIRKSVWA